MMIRMTGLTALKEKFGDAEYNVAMSVSDTRTDVMVNSAATLMKNIFLMSGF